MKKTVTTALAAAAIGLGGLALGDAALAQTYGSDEPAESSTDDAGADDADDGAGVDDVPDTGDAVDPSADDAIAPGPDPSVNALQAEGEGRDGRGCDGRSVETAAETIGISEDALRSELGSGQSIADVAVDHGMDPDEVVEALVTRSGERYAEKVADGDLTEAEAAERFAQETERITARVNGSDRG